MKKIGRIKYTTMGQYDPEVTYTEMNTVLYEGSRWEAKKETTGNAPPDNPKNDDGTLAENEFWRLFLPGALGDDYVKKTDLSKAPTETEPGKPGISYPDGKTIFADENGMLTGATSGKELTQEEMDEQLASGDLEPGSVVFLTGEAEGTNGLAIIVDKELNENSVHAIRNSAVAKAINAANALIAENQRLIAETQALRATLDSFGLSKICPVDVTDVTEANGMVLGAWEKNASLEGTLGNKIKLLENQSKWNLVDIDLVPAETIWSWNQVVIPEAIGAVRVKAYDDVAHVWSQTIEKFEGMNRVYYTNGILDEYNVTLQLEFAFNSGTLLLINQRVPQSQEVRFTKFAYQK